MDPRPFSNFSALSPRSVCLWRITVFLCVVSWGSCFSARAGAQADPCRARPETVVPAAQSWDRWIRKHKQFCSRAQQGSIDLLFLGDSIIENWLTVGADVWERHYGNRRAASFGIAGDRTQNLLWRIENGELTGVEPKLVVLQIGTNNLKLQRNTVGDTFLGVREVTLRLTKELPSARVLLMGLFPCGENRSERHAIDARELNKLLAKVDWPQSVTFLDLGHDFLNGAGEIQQALLPDYLHPSDLGYEVWASRIEPLVAQATSETK